MWMRLFMNCNRFMDGRFSYFQRNGGIIFARQGSLNTLVTTKKRRCKQVLLRVILLPSRHKTVVFQRFPRTRPTFSGLASQWRVLPSGSKPFRSFPCAHSAVRGGFGYPCSFKAVPWRKIVFTTHSHTTSQNSAVWNSRFFWTVFSQSNILCENFPISTE